MSKKIIIEYDVLYDLYITQNLSLPKVSKTLNVCSPSISKLLKEYNIVKTKEMIYSNHKGKNEIEKSLIEKYYLDNNLSKKETANKLNITEGVLERYLINYNIKKSKEDIETARVRQVKETAKTRDKSIAENFRNKYKQTCLERYGVDNGSKTEEAKEKISMKAELKNKELIELRRKQTCFNLYDKSHPSQRHIPKQIFDLIDNPANLHKYILDNPKKGLHVLSKQIGCAPEMLRARLNRFDLLKLVPQFTSTYETEIHEFLKEYGIETNKTRNVINPYEIDLYNEEHKIGIEFNGTYWHNTYKVDRNYHQDKSLKAEDKGVFIYHIFEYDWLNDIKKDIIKSQLLNLFKKNSIKIYARKCELKEVSYVDTKLFMEQNHLQGDGNLNKQINLGLYYNNKLVYMMTFGKWRRGYKEKLIWEIFRSCSLLNTTVVGGAEKCFKYFINKYKGNIGTYSSIQSGSGNLYKKLGFNFEKITIPSSIKTDGLNVYTMFSKNYQYEELLEIYGCGNKLWIFDN